MTYAYEKIQKSEIKHQKNHAVCNYEHGTYCETCGEFFEKGSEKYLRSNTIFSLYLVARNLLIEHPRSKKLRKIRDTLWNINKDVLSVGTNGEFVLSIEELREAEKDAIEVVGRFGANADSASIVLKSPKSNMIFED